MAASYPRIASFRTPAEFREYVNRAGIAIQLDDTVEAAPASPLARPYSIAGKTLANRFCILPMEGWDGTLDGMPTELTTRRWRNFGLSGAKLIWGGEAVAVRQDGRANPNQLLLTGKTQQGIESLRTALLAAHRDHCGSTDDLLVGLQLTHSGRFSRPTGKMEPKILYHHPLLDAKFHIPSDYPVLTDGEIDDLIGDYVTAAVRCAEMGFDFVDLKHCHGYLGHEFLSAVDRPGRYGGSFENRTRFLHEMVRAIRAAVPKLQLGVRVSFFDMIPFEKGPEGTGRPVSSAGTYRYAFGTAQDLAEPMAFLKLLQDLDIRLVCLTAGSPYYNPHIQRPAMFPPSDGYLPPEDPLMGVARQLQAVAQAKAAFPNLCITGSAYTYLQDYVPHVAQYEVRAGHVDFVGLGRMVLSYPRLPADVLAGRPLERKRICRTFSDCTSGPRNGLVSGCFPLDPFYQEHADRAKLQASKAKMMGR